MHVSLSQQSIVALQGAKKQLERSPLDSQFSRQFSNADLESVASSQVSSVSTRNQIDKCKDVILKALNLQKLVSPPRQRTLSCGPA